MNIADLCPRGRELYAVYELFHNRYTIKKAYAFNFITPQEIHVYQAYRQHVDECELCEELGDAND